MDIIQPMSVVIDRIHGINATGVEYIEDMYAVRWTHVYRGYKCGSTNEEHDK